MLSWITLAAVIVIGVGAVSLLAQINESLKVIVRKTRALEEAISIENITGGQIGFLINRLTRSPP